MEHNITDVIDARIRCLVLLVNDAMLLTSYFLAHSAVVVWFLHRLCSKNTLICYFARD